jgi:hypothetical protein
VIAVDDSPKPVNESVIHRFSSDLDVSYYSNSQRLGMAANWNRAVALSTGEWAMVVSQDDTLRPGMLRRYRELLPGRPVAIGCAREFIDSVGDQYAAKVRVTGRKPERKVYYRHSGYPGGLKQTNFAKLQAAKRPMAHAMKVTWLGVKGIRTNRRLNHRDSCRFR